jgi:NAD+ kinase
VLHPNRDSAGPVAVVLAWAAAQGRRVLGLHGEADRLPSGVEPVDAATIAERAGLLLSLGGDGTMLRALRMVHRHGVPVLGVNLGRLGFLAEIDVPDLPEALLAIERDRYTVETRLALLARIAGEDHVAFNDIALARRPGHGNAAIALRVESEEFVRYAADAVVVATPTGSTAYSFSAGGPIVSPRAKGLLVVPVAPHSTFNRAVFLDCAESLLLAVLPSSGALAIEVDGRVVGLTHPGDELSIGVDLDAGSVVRLGRRSFYARARRKLRVTDSAEL